MNDSILNLFEDFVLYEGHPALDGPHRSNRSRYCYANGSEIVLGSLDHRERLLSSEYDHICIFQAEEIHESDMEMLSTRLRRNTMGYHQLVCDLNPSHPAHWVRLRCLDGRMTMLTSVHQDNPLYYDHRLNEWTPEGVNYRAKLSGTTGVMRARYFLGEWVGMTGLVYPSWRREIHLIDQYVPQWTRRIVGIDPGYSNATAIVWACMDEDQRVIVYRLHYLSGRRFPTWVDEIMRCKSIDDAACPDIHWEFVIDSAGADQRAQLEHVGLPLGYCRKDIMAGIEIIQQRLDVQGDGLPRLFVMRDCLAHKPSQELRERHLPYDLVSEIEQYSWAEPKPGSNNKEDPQEFGDHSLDALRYLCQAAEAGISCRPNRIPNMTFDPFPRSAEYVRDFYSGRDATGLLEMYR